MIRLFTGLEIPEEVGRLLAGLRGGLHGARWIGPENYHITLRFIGDIDGRTAEEVAEALSRVRRPGVAVRLSGLDAFGGARPHALWARVEPSPALTELQAEHERVLQRLGLPGEGRKYTPHLTMARLRGTSAAEVARWLALNGGFSLPPFVADRFVLFSARAAVGGGPYLVEEAFPLTA